MELSEKIIQNRNKRVKEAVKAKGLTLIQVSKILNITPNTLTVFLMGRINLAIDKMIILSEITDCSIEWLFGLESKSLYNREIENGIRKLDENEKQFIWKYINECIDKKATN